jgi:hypothetical protein
MFAWSEVENVESVRVLGLPFFGEGVRITLEEVMFWGVPRRLLFFSGIKARTGDILGFAESRGAKARRRARQGQEHVRGTLREHRRPRRAPR